jgi:hypothetical protein
MERARVEERNVRSEKSDNRCNYLKEDFTSRIYDLMRDTSLNQDKDISINDLDTYFKSKIDSIYQSEPHLKQAVISL